MWHFVAAMILFVSGLGVWISKSIRSRRFDPNAQDPEKRIEIGRSRAYLRSELEEELRAREE
jgi:hypothetical protein